MADLREHEEFARMLHWRDQCSKNTGNYPVAWAYLPRHKVEAYRSEADRLIAKRDRDHG